VENAAIAPEILGIGKERVLMRGYGNRDPARNGFRIALALIPVVMSVQDPIDFADTEVAKMVENLSGSEVHKNGI
jgi:hypothetical protein